jgi:LytS/YehU family sensor histidine kinase
VGHLLEGGVVRVEAAVEGASLRITVANPCDPERPQSTGAGFGLPLLRQRLETEFGAEGRVREREADAQYEVVISMPARPPAGAGADE